MISKIHKNGTVNLNYDDGDREDFVSIDRIRLITLKEQRVLWDTIKSDKVKPPSSGALEKGMRLMGEYQKGGMYYPGVIAGVHSHHTPITYDINYDDGDRENRVERRHFRFFYDSERPKYVVCQQCNLPPRGSERRDTPDVSFF